MMLRRTVRGSRRRLRRLLTMTGFFDGITKDRHPEEARSAVSKDAQRHGVANAG